MNPSNTITVICDLCHFIWLVLEKPKIKHVVQNEFMTNKQNNTSTKRRAITGQWLTIFFCSTRMVLLNFYSYQFKIFTELNWFIMIYKELLCYMWYKTRISPHPVLAYVCACTHLAYTEWVLSFFCNAF